MADYCIGCQKPFDRKMGQHYCPACASIDPIPDPPPRLRPLADIARNCPNAVFGLRVAHRWLHELSQSTEPMPLTGVIRTWIPEPQGMRWHSAHPLELMLLVDTPVGPVAALLSSWYRI